MKPRQVKAFAGYSIHDRGRSVGIAPDHTAPTITSADAVDITSNDTVVQLTANETVTWSIVGGTDQSSFALDGASMLISIADLSTPKVYNVIIRATDTAGNHTDQTFNATVVAAS